ncbi:MAG TPA: type II toxin-antitoxin system prevent-host-death family antitoxin [Acetobacteraceae bacterium]|nr:type II toxin-antitoxin system prevent-host-death family antitoxin [Acetobacteraceae bacterium]HQU01430.1 type II toxin-antitoxin system prevent-host-death family antitoxin [Acetobacteraceae bacterium]
MNTVVSLYDAKTHLSGLVDQAAAGSEIVISKNGVPLAKLVPLAFQGVAREPANALNVITIAADFDAPDEALNALFGYPSAPGS